MPFITARKSWLPSCKGYIIKYIIIHSLLPVRSLLAILHVTQFTHSPACFECVHFRILQVKPVALIMHGPHPRAGLPARAFDESRKFTRRACPPVSSTAAFQVTNSPTQASQALQMVPSIGVRFQIVVSAGSGFTTRHVPKTICSGSSHPPPPPAPPRTLIVPGAWGLRLPC